MMINNMKKDNKKMVYLTKKDIENIVDKGFADVFYKLSENSFGYDSTYGEYIGDEKTYDENTYVKIDDEEMVQVFDECWGDGNEWYKTFHFPNWDFYVSIEGTYSSHGDSYWGSIYFSEPYEHTETRFKKKGK